MYINFKKTPYIYWSRKAKIEYLQRHIIVHSILYYELNDSVILDKEFDEMARLLLKCKNEHRDDFKASMYYYCFKDFDGHTGFDLYSRLKIKDKRYLRQIALVVLKQYKEGGKRNG